ncbi:MAG: nickel pincer cofactor biosynthesis protein LarC [Desulfobacteraceae bacterium]|nr:MAG: nickel pincer cofactor biosynthesis protein LarC [Desulfobacteraceae bacterium]
MDISYRVDKMKTAYLDCFSGISGDMFVGALLDAGLSFTELKAALQSLALEGYELQSVSEERNYIYGTRFSVQVDQTKQKARGLSAIAKLIQDGDLSPWVKETTIRIFESLARVEAQIHGCSMEEVHFHEIGAVDSIMDIVGTVYGVESLGIETMHASALPLGSGLIQCAHGQIPNPAPATLALLKNIPVYAAGLQYELVTPTGAALITGLTQSFGTLPAMKIEKTGYGVGGYRLPDRPNLLRLIIGESEFEGATETLVQLEVNLDDSNPEWLGFLMDRLFQAGALDVAFSPLQMKKNRPAALLRVLAQPTDKDRLMELIFRESTTLGVRFHYLQRTVLPKIPIELESPWGKIRANKIIQSDGSFFMQPEFEACQRLALEKSIALKKIYAWIMRSGC